MWAHPDTRLFQHLIVWQSLHEITWNVPFSPQKTQEFQDEVMKARGARRWFNFRPCDVTRFLRDKHDRSSRQLGLCKFLILIVYHVSYEAHNYDSVGRVICTETVVCFDQSNLLALRGVRIFASGCSCRVETSLRSPNNTMQLIPVVLQIVQ